jgi:hypothetical protein
MPARPMPLRDNCPECHGTVDAGSEAVSLLVVVSARMRRSGNASAASAICVVTLAGLTACSSFAPAPPDADAAAPADAAAAPDAQPIRDAGADAAPCLSFLCEDFESESWRKWSLIGLPGALDVTMGPATSGVRALDLQIAKNNTATIIVQSLGAARRVTLAVNMLVVTKGDGDIDFVNLVEGAQAGAAGLHITYVQGAGRYAVEPPKVSPSALAEAFNSYARVKLELDRDTRTYAFTIGSENFQGTLDQGVFATNNLYVSLGAAYAVGITNSWHVRFDDLEVTTEP